MAAVEIVTSAPVRTADVGGWTDTWFAGTGVVCNVALDARVHVRVVPAALDVAAVRLGVGLTGESYDLVDGEPVGRHPMLEAAVLRCWPGRGALVHVGGALEAGSGLGSSASVMVALVAALVAAAGHPAMHDRGEIARIAHECEVAAGRQSGVQDHVAAAYGGISRIDVDYPHARRVAVDVPPGPHGELAARLHTISFGHEHASSSIHDEVIAGLADTGVPAALDRLRRVAAHAADVLGGGDLVAYGATLTDGHEAMRTLHGEIVSVWADELADIAGRFGARGWKANGAGGDGGSMVVLGPTEPAHDVALVDALTRRDGWHVVDVPLADDGVRIEQRSLAADRWVG